METEPITLDGWLQQFKTHDEENPTHGHNCICVDKFATQLRVAMHKADLTNKQRSSVQTVFHYLTR